jgi:hypothetical protein
MERLVRVLFIGNDWRRITTILRSRGMTVDG